jgi:hypothetical protein
MDWFSVAVALLLPWLAGALWLRLLWTEPAPGRWPMLIGYGGVLGALLTAFLLHLMGSLGLALRVWPALIVFILAIACAVWLLWRSRTHPGQDMTAGRERISGEALPIVAAMPAWQWMLFALLLVWVLVRLSGLTLEVWWRPLYPWDAWTTWAVRARAWAELQSLVPFISPEVWLSGPSTSAYTISAWAYPSTVSLFATWPALAYGAWNETAANLPWIGCALALLFGFYGQARRWGASPLEALVAIWLLASLPLLNTHIALAGYADLWLGTLLGLALMAFLHWARDRDWRQGLIALGLVLCLPLVKDEGAVWAALFVPALVAVWLPLRGWLLLAALSAALGLGVWMGGWLADGLRLTLPLLGELALAPDRIDIPGLGNFELAYQGDWQPIWKHLFVLSSWHLFALLLLLALALAIDQGLRGGLTEPWQRAGLAWVLAALLALYLLFFWTLAAEWAAKGTSINRILLQFAPALLFWMLSLWVQIKTHPGPWRNARGQSLPG